MMHDMNGWWMLWGALMMVVFWGGLIALVAWTVQSVIPRHKPLDIARERLARGEISVEEFERIKAGLAT